MDFVDYLLFGVSAASFFLIIVHAFLSLIGKN